MEPTRHPRYARHRFPAEVISHAVWLYFRFPLSLRMVEEMLAARGIVLSHETVRQWARKLGQAFANQIRRRLPCAGDKWHLDEVEVKIAGQKHWLWRAVDQTGMVLDVLVQSRRAGWPSRTRDGSSQVWSLRAQSPDPPMVTSPLVPLSRRSHPSQTRSFQPANVVPARMDFCVRWTRGRAGFTIPCR